MEEARWSLSTDVDFVTWRSVEEAPPALWAAFTYLREILRLNTAQDGVRHESVEHEPDRVCLDKRERPVFVYPDGVYSFDRKLGMVFETRNGIHVAY